MKPHVFHPEADSEYAEAAAYYAEHGHDLGGRFYEEIERIIAEIVAAPRRFREYDPPARRNLARDFPYAGRLSRSAGPHLDRGGYAAAS